MKKLLLTFLIAFITALGLNAEVTSPYEYTFASGELSEAAGSKKFNEVTWSWTKMTFLGFTNNAVQIGSSKKPQNSDWTISTTGISGTITSVKVNAWTGGSATLKVSVGGTAFACGSNTTKNLGSSSEDKNNDFTGSASGEIKITMNASSKAMYLQSIKVTFTTGGGSTETTVLGNIMYNGEAVPDTISLKGGETLTFTSANAVSMTLVANGDEANKITTLDTGEISWTAPAATDEEQVIDLKVVSQLQNEGEELQKKEAFVTVTIPVKSNVSDDFTLITDAGDLYDGMEMYIVSGTKALSTTQNNNNRGQTEDLTINNGILTPTSSAQLITLEATNVTKKPWKFNVGDGYLYAASSSSNYLKTSASPSNDNEKATISIETNGNATITFQGKSERNVLKYNSKDGLFSCYTKGQTEVQIYAKKTMTAVAPEAPTFTPDGGEVDLFSTVKIACATEGATLTYKIGDGEAKAYPADGIKMTEAGEVTITAIATKNGLSTETTKTFNVTDKREKVYVKFDANEYEFTVGQEFESPVAKACTYNNEHFVEIPNFTGTIIYESDDTSVADVNATTGALTLKAAGTCKITASLKSETYKSDPDYYTLKVNKGLVDGLIEYPVSEFVYTIGSGEQLPVLYKYPDNVDVEYSISHERVENGVAVYHPATIDEQGNITVNTPGIVRVTATVKANPDETSSYVLEIQSLREAEIASTVKAPVVHITGGNVYYSPEGEWYWGTENENHVLSFANETDGADIYYIESSATPSSANVRAMANSATDKSFKKSDLDGKKITFWAEKDGQKSAVETLNFNIKTGIEDIDVENPEAVESEDGDARYFNLQGLEVKNPGEGIYIRVANGKATKILKK